MADQPSQDQTRELFGTLAARLARRAWRDLLVRRTAAGLFFGLLPAAFAAFVSGSVRLPVPALPLAVGLAAAGCAAGLVSALFHGVDRRRLLMAADKSLGSRELVSTAFELAQKADNGVFADAVLEDASRLLARTSPRTILGRLRLPLVPFIALTALVAAAGLLFPFDIRGLLPRRSATDQELAQIGEDLRNSGLRLAEDARAHDLERSLALSQELAQLGSDLAARRIQPDDALDRMSELESGLAQEYQLRRQEAEAQLPSGRAGQGTGAGSAESGRTSPGPGADLGGSSGESALGDTLDKLRQAQRQLNGRGAEGGQGDGAQAQAPPRLRRQRSTDEAQQGSQELPPGAGGLDQAGQESRDKGPDSGGAGRGDGAQGRTGESGGSGVGTLPAPMKRGPPSDIIDNKAGRALQAPGSAAEGDSTRLLARALPQWTGSRLPEEAILNRYSRQAESALARDEIPLQLKEYVKHYFTVIGMGK